METNYKDMNKVELIKAIYLQQLAVELGMDVGGCGEVNVNKTSGNTYIWLEDYPFSLFLSTNSVPKKDNVRVCYTDFETGWEYFLNLTDDTTLDQILDWCEECEKSAPTNVR